ARAIHDRDSAVALKIIKSLYEIAGQSNVFDQNGGGPLINALGYPDRLVRFEAAFTVAQSLPQKNFQGQERVVPLLAEAMVKTGASPYVQQAATDPSISTTQATDAAGLKGAIEAARNRAGALPLDPKIATEYALRAGELLQRLAISRGQVMDLSAAQPTMLAL